MRIHVRRVSASNGHLSCHILLPRVTCEVIVIQNGLNEPEWPKVAQMAIVTQSSLSCQSYLSTGLDTPPLWGVMGRPKMSPKRKGGGSCKSTNNNAV